MMITTNFDIIVINDLAIAEAAQFLAWRPDRLPDGTDHGRGGGSR